MNAPATLTVELPAALTEWVKAEAARRTVGEEEIVRGAVEAAAERSRRVSTAIQEIVTDNAELYRRLS
ncbi:hypothetical protein [Alienimonas chondri]|uniref:Uncharacterized protein n=1 Tax=Alienimonas chondri TaxID=2681879 RepID=A0ABX1VC76_9PLAN|nr:hypothetical protein [Alienimonas chondri]NNJ25041.1 hypothetical protein [Alienimonas chondri]